MKEVTCKFQDETYHTIHALAARKGIPPVDLIAKAIQVYQLLQQDQDHGAKVLIQSKYETRELVNL